MFLNHLNGKCPIKYSVIIFLANTVFAFGLVYDISGQWDYELDPGDVGYSQNWYERDLANSGFTMPGTTSEKQLGTLFDDPADELTVSTIYHFKQRYSYLGNAWYQRDITVPAGWNGKQIILFLENITWQSTVWIDDDEVGSQDGLATPHIYDITNYIQPGTSQRLTIRIDNRDIHNIGTGSHAYGTETQPQWNGIVGKMEIRGTDKVWIKDVQIYPDVTNKEITFKIKTGNTTGYTASVGLTVSAESTNTATNHYVSSADYDYLVTAAEENNEFDYTIGNDQLLWDEHSPAVYDFSVSLSATANSVNYSDTKEYTFGMRSFAADGTQLKINDNNTIMRGTLECAIYPITGYPPMDVSSWENIMGLYKDYGFNHVRFHSWCPPEAAFIAADRIGIYLQPEGPDMWGSRMSTDPDNFNFYKNEAIRVVDTYGNHPSFCTYSNGNELSEDLSLLKDITNTLKARDSRRLYTLQTGKGAEEIEDDIVDKPNGRGNIWGSGDYSTAVSWYTKPLIHHEIGQWQVFPDISEIPQYNGVMRPFNFEVIKNDLINKNLDGQASNFVAGSGRLSFRLYKAEIETSLRTPAFGGFQILALQDYPGYGLASDGMLDCLYNSKGITTASEFKSFCGPTVPLLELPASHKNYVYKNSDTFSADVLASHFGRAALSNVDVLWSLKKSDQTVIDSGSFDNEDIQVASGTHIGSINNVSLSGVTDADKCTLTLTIDVPGANDFTNSWSIWVYPAILSTSEETLLTQGNIMIASSYTNAVESHLDNGGNVLVIPGAGDLKSYLPGMFKPVFWAVALWGEGSSDKTMGFYADNSHHVFDNFPTDYYSDYQWQDLMDNSNSMILDELPATFLPVVQVIPNSLYNYKLGNLLEANISNGKVVICSIDIKNNLSTRHSARQLRHSVLSYMASENFSPAETLEKTDLLNILNINLWTRVDDTNESLTWSSGWLPWEQSDYYGGSCVFTKTAGDTVEFPFYGKIGRVIGLLRNDLGLMDIYVDDVFQETIDCYSSTTQYQPISYETDILQLDNHTIRVEVKGQKNPSSSDTWIVLDAFAYTEINLSWCYAEPNNLASSATASASSVWSGDYTADKANDDNWDTRWAAAAGDINGAWLEMDFGKEITFNRAGFQQYDDRIQSYKIQYYNGSWQNAYVGGFMSESPETVVFDEVTGTKARIFVTESTDVPTIFEFQIYPSYADFDGSGKVDLTDLAILCAQWLALDCGSIDCKADLYHDGVVNFIDYCLLSNQISP